ncbi:MAG: bifunctional diaminohydroxyphosphoribosylaminopyrimidine deaminase/5-amino-6-(5-phosphoribosylamino)uracil reductase RibD [Sphingobacteriales bacterium]|nr:MAG: bifunctional diaminohydroxyphosphoribosylaminopyrimidine deaminase/5-amino-6-(5-phosphoribosylamino)uracil reductase RibD [Sphingobacteriales bacterium]
MHYSDLDRKFMRRALDLAYLGRFSAHPNPMVGCVIVKNSEIIGEGYHSRAGGEHAEIVALRGCMNEAQGATAYVTLEPCSHYGRRPPCANALIESGISEVVIACEDVNPLVNGRGRSLLEENGIKVHSGLLSTDAKAINRGFEKRFLKKLPFVTLKIASSIDGKVALRNGLSQWITSPSSRRDVQKLRGSSSVILTSITTVERDDCRLNVRWDEIPDLPDSFNKESQPWRVIVDSNLRIRPHMKVLNAPGRTIVATVNTNGSLNNESEVWRMSSSGGRVNLRELLEKLALEGANHVLVEAGATLSSAFIQEKYLRGTFIQSDFKKRLKVALKMSKKDGETSRLNDKNN